ncbi:nuclear transport factor 2 family protein [Sphingobacterium spiritivorum]|uniref:Uncharacterized protein n=1 Tax=Sphingobacterium spiritivorum ATCC 33861 TaxID=525373 RepID=D7VQS9_SPHSI|nr:hypothetical protein [Sphingobacterium spiritivorum]EFK56130.1 hypothetical protein HMPREF0766_13333 [Sphingobacterium spiritivorum ATCC 33861]QQT35753.1 hypothetical protein I6J01_21280 [Sphingobacterium spiritivorum]WQD32473.1 hypothetical protein U0038_13225 [Sphingobacterium spiritivorum]SUJ09875.1 Uncharacterised protein [Sphingobacterium spiritivorum]
MKNAIKSIATALILVTSLSAFAGENTNPVKTNSVSTVKSFLEATTLGNLNFNNQLFAKDFEYYTVSKPNEKFNKNQYTEFLKNTKGLQYDCITSYQVLDENSDICVAKATMAFKNFTRVDYITLTRSQDVWKVSKVVTTYP